MLRRIKRFFLLTTAEKVFFCQAVCLLAYSRLVLHRMPFQKLIDPAMASSSRGSICPASRKIPLASMIRLFARACRYVPFSTCLSRAIAAQRLLRSYGVFPTLHIGVARQEGKELEAHAWLSLEGNIILGDTGNLQRYSELPSLAQNHHRKEI